MSSIPRRWAFLVGINEYTDYPNLRYCVDDVLALEAFLNQVGYIPVCLHDRMGKQGTFDQSISKKRFPTKTNVKSELRSLVDRVQADDLLLVYFACHGVRGNDDRPRLIAEDTRRNEPDSFISIVDELEPLIKGKARQTILMFDACFIGTGRSAPQSEDPAEFIRRVNELSAGYHVLAASQEHEAALEVEDLKHSIFCHYVLEGLKGKADVDGSKKCVTVNDLKNYVLVEMEEYAVRNSLRQTPQGRSEGTLGDFILVEDYTNINSTFTPTLDQLNDCLWLLNYDQQCQTVKNRATRSQRASVFVVKAKDDPDASIHHWQLRKLIKQIPNPAQVMVYKIVIPKHRLWQYRDLKGLWEDLAQKLSCDSDPTVVIQNLVDTYKNKSVVFALHGWNEPPRTSGLQLQVLDLQKKVLCDFWEPLVREVRKLDLNEIALGSRLILFLAEGREDWLDPALTSTSNDGNIIPIRLDPLEITDDDVVTWVEQNAKPILIQLNTEEKIKAFIDQGMADLSTDPVSRIEQICKKLFNLENGIADIEQEWRLAG